MIWDGVTVYTTWGYVPQVERALDWDRDSQQYWFANDRGVDQDAYSGAIVFKGPQDELADLEGALADNREGITITCGIGEEIFGADIDYSDPLSVTVADFGRCDRVSFGQFSMPLKLRLLAPTFKSVTPSLSALRLSSWRYGASASFAVGKGFSMEGAATYSDFQADTGIFEGEFTQTQAEMEAIRRYLLSVVRGADFSFPSLGGVEYPFGTRKPPLAACRCRVREFEELGRDNLTNWRFRLVLTEAP